MPLSIGTVASHYSLTIPFNVYDYPANELSYATITNTTGLTSGGFDTSGRYSPKCTFDIEQGFWYKLIVEDIGRFPSRYWNLGKYIFKSTDYFTGNHLGTNTCDFGACFKPGGPRGNDDHGEFYFFATVSGVNVPFCISGSPLDSAAYNGVYKVQLLKQNLAVPEWTLLTSMTDVSATITTLAPNQTFLIHGRNTSGLFDYDLFFNGVYSKRLPRLPAVFEYPDQVYSGTWTIYSYLNDAYRSPSRFLRAQPFDIFIKN